MKIIYCLESLANSGGIERIITHRAGYMAAEWGYEVIIVTTDQGDAPPFYPLSDRVGTIDLGINYRDIKRGSRLFFHIRFRKKREEHRRKLRELLEKEKPDITVSTFNGTECTFLPLLKDGSRKFGEIHVSLSFITGMTGYKEASRLQKWKKRLDCMRLMRLMKKYDRLVVLSRSDYYHLYGRLDNVVCIPNFFSWQVTEGAYPEESRTILSVGRLDYLKGHDRLLRIWKELEPDYPGWNFRIYGNGEKDGLQRYIDRNGLQRVEIHSAVSHIKEIYGASALFILGSRTEGFSLVLLEALSQGLPVVAFDCEAGPRDIIVPYFNGFLIPDGDSEAFVSSMKRLMDNTELRKNYSRNALDKVKEFGMERIMGMWKEILS